jgi:hypothetical protein
VRLKVVATALALAGTSGSRTDTQAAPAGTGDGVRELSFGPAPSSGSEQGAPGFMPLSEDDSRVDLWTGWTFTTADGRKLDYVWNPDGPTPPGCTPHTAPFAQSAQGNCLMPNGKFVLDIAAAWAVKHSPDGTVYLYMRMQDEFRHLPCSFPLASGCMTHVVNVDYNSSIPVPLAGQPCLTTTPTCTPFVADDCNSGPDTKVTFTYGFLAGSAVTLGMGLLTECLRRCRQRPQEAQPEGVPLVIRVANPADNPADGKQSTDAIGAQNAALAAVAQAALEPLPAETRSL